MDHLDLVMEPVELRAWWQTQWGSTSPLADPCRCDGLSIAGDLDPSACVHAENSASACFKCS